MSPAGEAFCNRIRMYPSFVDCTTIDWFSERPTGALLEAADKYLDSPQVFGDEEDKLKPALAQMVLLTHRSVFTTSQRMYDEMKRQNYVTPTNYLELVADHRELPNLKRMLTKPCISACQIQWTADVTKARGLSKERGDHSQRRRRRLLQNAIQHLTRALHKSFSKQRKTVSTNR